MHNIDVISSSVLPVRDTEPVRDSGVHGLPFSYCNKPTCVTVNILQSYVQYNSGNFRNLIYFTTHHEGGQNHL